MEFRFANRMKYLKESEVRELLKYTQNEEIISFAGGLPAPELFPVKEIMEASQAVLLESGTKALQYSMTEGYEPLRKWIANRHNKRYKTTFDEDCVLITTGSQQVLDFSGKVFLDEGDIVLCESPTYLAAITAFKAYGCKFIEVATDNDGMVMEDLERILKETKNVKLIYVIPDFQNPTGRTWTVDRREGLSELSKKYGVVVIEDNPYGELRFEGEELPCIQAISPYNNVLYTGTFSKTFCPGYRVGWAIGDKGLISKYTLIKQSADLQSNTLAQMEIAKYLELNDIDAHIKKIKSVYKKRRDLLIKTMEEEFPKGVTYTTPQGGLFAWVSLPKNISSRDIFLKCIKKNVAFVPGDSFFPNGGQENHLRVNFSNMPEERIVEGIKRMGEVLRETI